MSTRSLGWLRRHSLVLVAALGGAAGVAYAAGWHHAPAPAVSTTPPMVQAVIALPSQELPRDTVQDTIQIALILDTSGSMDGLINQARSQLWSMVDQMGTLQREVKGKMRGVKVELALYEYGNSTLAATNEMRQVLPFSSDLDMVSEKLHGLFTNGGEEYAGMAIKKAVDELQWSKDPDTLKFIYIAGNESLEQGTIKPDAAIKAAQGKDISVQFILCGSDDETWKNGAVAAKTDLLTIDQSRVAAHIPAPQDDEILRLNNELNNTYLAYGREGAASMARQSTADRAAYRMSKKVALERAQLKSKKAYSNARWDIVDAVDKNAKFLEEEKDENLPAEMRGKSVAEKKQIVAAKAQARTDLKAKIAKLEAERTTFIAAEKAKTGSNDDKMLDAEMMKNTKHAAAKKGYK